MPDFAKALLDTIDLRAETKWLKQRLESENCPVVFCHNDMQEGNILMCQDFDKENNNADPKLSFDIANHFAEWAYDYTEPNHPFYREDWTNYPTDKQRLAFVRAYLDERGSRENPKKVLREVEVFTLASHFFWSLWGVVNAGTSKIPFGYWTTTKNCSKIFVNDMAKIVSHFPQNCTWQNKWKKCESPTKPKTAIDDAFVEADAVS
ncbi:hypothetical protein NQ314_018438 [Rhamnusium bicolor]|uniref:Ethanolamine kinase n=1 Tax=Rhamnusium bicolor TaxID=1586634 RepID=A0AAV8WQ80_9CUCU|nr:hypothetical protein NQ314_018438 [Rhamnusium bicolor]